MRSRVAQGSVGAIQLMQLASRLEKTNHDTMRLKASGLLEELHRTTKQALSVLEQHLETRRGRAASGDFD